MEWFKPGLSEGALKKEYRKLARQFHPDVCKDPGAEEKMKEINYQFDEYFAHQKRFEFAWAGEAAARQAARKTRYAILVRMYWNKELGHYTTRLEYQYHHAYRTFWGDYGNGWEEFILGHGVDEPGEYTWENFNGGLAYVSYEKDVWGVTEEVNLKRLPATITPASPEEVFWFNKDRWLDSEYDRFIQADCRFGKGIIFKIDTSTTSSLDPYASRYSPKYFGKRSDNKYDRVYADMMMKVTLPDAFLIGNPDPVTNAQYEARSIQMVRVRLGSLGRLENVIELTGEDFPYMVYQECTRVEFEKYHDVDCVPHQFTNVLPCRRVDADWIPGSPDPIIDYFYRKGIIRLYCSRHNFRMMYGYFHRRTMEQNMELLSMDDAEIVQDFLDMINENFNTELKKMIRSGRIQVKI